jgi:hypothetical protein
MGAAMFLDLLWPVLVLAGAEQVRIEPDNTTFTPLAFDYDPFSYSLVNSLALSGLIALGYCASRGMPPARGRSPPRCSAIGCWTSFYTAQTCHWRQKFPRTSGSAFGIPSPQR